MIILFLVVSHSEFLKPGRPALYVMRELLHVYDTGYAPSFRFTVLNDGFQIISPLCHAPVKAVQ